MKAKAVCPHCNVTVSYDVSDMGVTVACGNCANAFNLPSVDLPQGYEVGGFVIESLLGQGSMGKVYKAIQKSMNRPVALKIIKPEITSDERNVEDFLKEIQMLAAFNHANIVTAIEAGQQGNLHFLAMEYMHGISLDEPLSKGEVFSEKDTLTLTRSIASALERAWSEYKMIHCDIKPANIMLDKNNNPKLMDLGISQCAHDQHSDGTIVGTPFYMSPEQAACKTLDFRSDMFSLGSSMFHMMTGEYPFWGNDPLEVIEAVKNTALPVHTLKGDEITKGTCNLISKMCAKEPDERFTSWEGFINELDLCLNPKVEQKKKVAKKNPVKSSSISNVNRARKVVQHRKKKQSNLLAIMIVMVITGAATYFLVDKYILKKNQAINKDKATITESSTNSTKENPQKTGDLTEHTDAENNKIDKKSSSLSQVKDLSLLKNLRRLRRLVITDSKLNNLELLTSLNLKSITLENVYVKDWSAIKDLNHLERIEIDENSNIRISDLAELPNLTSIKITGLKSFSYFAKGFQSLRDLETSKVDRPTIRFLSRLNLSTLVIERSPISDLEDLLKLESLKSLSLKSSLFDKEELRTIAKQMPNCKIQGVTD